MPTSGNVAGVALASVASSLKLTLFFTARLPDRYGIDSVQPPCGGRFDPTRKKATMALRCCGENYEFYVFFKNKGFPGIYT